MLYIVLNSPIARSKSITPIDFINALELKFGGAINRDQQVNNNYVIICIYQPSIKGRSRTISNYIKCINFRRRNSIQRKCNLFIRCGYSKRIHNG